jgi:phage head maturation protease
MPSPFLRFWASEAETMDKLINFGGAVKALGEGVVEGYLVLFGTPDETDASGLRDFFTPETDFGLADGMKSTIWYRHALEPSLDRPIGEGALKADDVGVFITGQLNLRDRYVKAVYDQMACKGKLGWSSGSVSHLVRREPQENGAHKITRWHLGLDASLTPDPAEPRTQVAVKSLTDLPAVAPLEELLPEIKAQFLGEYVEREMTLASLRTLNDALMYSVVARCLYDDQLTPEQKQAHLAGAFAEFSALALETLSPLLAGTDSGALKALRTLWGPERPESLVEHAAKVVSASAEFANRLETRLEVRQTDGRTLSAAQRDALKAVVEEFNDLDAVKAHLLRTLAAAEGKPTPTREDTERLRTAFLRLTSPVGAN